MIDIEGMATFAAVIEASSFTEAARRMGTVKSVISRRIRNLETVLGVTLLERSAQRVRPTEIGAVYYSKCVDILQAIDSANEFASGFDKLMGGDLHVSLPSAFASKVAAPIIAAFSAQHPSLRLHVEIEERDASLVDARFDIAVRIGPLPDSSLLARSICTTRHVICASPGYLREHGVPQTLADLESHVALSHSYTDGHANWQLRNGDALRVVHMRERLRSSCRLQLLEATRAGLGLSLLPSYLVRDAIVAGELTIVMGDCQPPPQEVCLVYSQARRLSAKVQALISHAVQSIGSTPSWEAGIDWGGPNLALPHGNAVGCGVGKSFVSKTAAPLYAAA